MMKQTIAVICGGRSGEHEVSLTSAQSIVDALDRFRFNVLTIGIDRHGAWWLGSNVIDNLRKGQQPYGQRVYFIPDPTCPGLIEENPVTRKPVPVDVFFPVLHGPNGEDGTIQGLFEAANVPYVGCGVLASACGMDKAIMKALFAQSDLPQLPYLVVLRNRWESAREQVIDEVEDRLGYPCFVKPANMGSSVGISKATNRAELVAAFDDAVRYDRKLIVEKGINVREIEVSVLGNDEVVASVPGEIVPAHEFYDYDAKYAAADSRLLIPAPIAAADVATFQEMAIRAFRAIDGSGLSRVDFLLDKNSGEVYINEINTLPGFTSISMYPKLWEATGIPYGELLSRLVDLGLARYREKQRNATERLPRL
ncbi:d-alanine--d-alanine ligase, putative [Heliomicrobium modesticaldum Ice1]|uniref:D-alanine--D-alanine ligase n=1 Tax=Heliobacterium modesticaldum (strain ATCC 51547 / Ice1) TaxID=498761 RepID=DDL_HELMI|nr:D-alanine--D-alanine ligase [Heliomicrobium modesticaldum]B0TAZ6.1 RecName: Full=D-alanine--D-alanine ligase; AltName: Full=D-Ala-D-Ala ligase; AltName: Full=D-alanylalanine synthetase [Heliomicrobium modesticaldum Ice1]ABZ85107.1 d-alanine--d-alanine ligase, putative [Heliomicrobium modesticaldum Ice1]